jgi:thermitase
MKNLPMTRRILNVLLAALFLLLPCLTFAEEPTQTTNDPAYGAMEFKAGEIIVKFKEGIPKASVPSLLLAENLSILDEMGQLGILLLSVPEGQELKKIEELKRNPLVEYAEPNYMIQVANTIGAEPHCSLRTPDVWPNDPYLPNQWNLSKVEAFAAWEITSGSDKVVIAFVDSGVDLEHPEFKDKIWTNDDPPGDADGDGDPDDDHNGFVDDVHGWDFVNWDGQPQSDFWLGTYVSSIAAAEANNQILIAGVSWGAEIMPIKVIDDRGSSYHWHTTGGIKYAADNGAKIINLSWSLRSPIAPQPLQEAINYAYDKGALVIAGSGDPNPKEPIPPDAYQYPAALDHVVSVAATDYDDRHPDFSTYNDKVDVAAPGVGIWGIYSYSKSPIAPIRGTYAAAAQVSGLAALIWSVNPTLTNDEVEEIIISTAVDLGEPGRDDYFGCGRIDASAAVRATPHYLEVETDDPLYFLVCDDGHPSSRKITNPNTNYSTWNATPTDPSWLSTSHPEGYTPSSVTVSIVKSGLADYDVYTGTIIATSTMTSCENCLRTLIVTAEYTQCWRSYLPLLFKKP